MDRYGPLLPAAPLFFVYILCAQEKEGRCAMRLHQGNHSIGELLSMKLDKDQC
jgi:hypothetical protein